MAEKVEFIESYIKLGNGGYQWNDNHGELVRCKDCKHFKDNRCLNDNVHYSIDDCGCQPAFYVTDDWFCAEGERR